MTLRANKNKFKARQQRQTLRKGVGEGKGIMAMSNRQCFEMSKLCV